MRRVPRFYVDPDAVAGGTVEIRGDDAAHLARSLRVRPGEQIVVVEDGFLEHGVVIREVGDGRVSGAIEWTRPATGDPALRVDAMQALPARGMDDAVEALSVAGVHTIHPVVTERTVVRPHDHAIDRKVMRWRAVAREAAQLAGRARPPAVAPVRSLGDALNALPSGCRILAFVADSSAVQVHAVKLGGAAAACVIGPEGGLGPADIAELRAAGAMLTGLGPRIVPTRLAGFLAVSLLLYAAGDLRLAAADAPVTIDSLR